MQKAVKLYFYTMSVERVKKSVDDTPYNINAIITAFSHYHSNHSKGVD